MNLQLDLENLSDQYTSNSQKIRVLTETWVSENMFCPRCAVNHIEKFENNRPVADFYCEECKNIYELKSKSGKLSDMINDGAYSTMIERITSNTNPDFFFMNYDKNTYEVRNFLVIPKHFFTPNIIIKRKPLSQNARRAGWVGCNIDLSGIPQEGRIFIIKNGREIPKENVVDNIHKNLFLGGEEISSRGWLLDIMRCAENIKTQEFSLSEIYDYEKYLQELHPNNHNIKAKIRQQLQILRDNGYIEFLGNGKYVRRNYEEI